MMAASGFPIIIVAAQAGFCITPLDEARPFADTIHLEPMQPPR